MVLTPRPLDRCRDVFPLPFFSEEGCISRRAVGKTMSRQKREEHHTTVWANDGIAALNDLMGCGHRHVGDFIPACAADAARHVYSAYADLGGPTVRSSFIRGLLQGAARSDAGLPSRASGFAAV